jgi:hypothetical protein
VAVTYREVDLTLAAVASLKAQSVPVEIVRGGGSLLPGTGNEISEARQTTLIGPLAFAPPPQDDRVRYAPADELADVCRSETRLDWMEVLASPPHDPR